jgi:hypothetical protein
MWNIFCLSSLARTVFPANLPVDSERSYMWPLTNTGAQSVYLGEEWSDKDELGHLRVHPCEKWWSGSERVPPYIHPSRKVPLGDPLGSSLYSRVYSVPGTPWAIKYHAYCPDRLDPHEPTLVEAYFLKVLSQWQPQVSNRLIYFSRSFTPWTRSDLKYPNFGLKCPGLPSVRPVVRFIITERVGRSIKEILISSTTLFSFREAISCGIRLFQLLKTIHERNLVHGDIHPGNVAFRSDAETHNELVLIDFGRARVVDVGEAVGETRSQPFCHYYLSPWEALYLGRPTYRDDAFRAILVMASMMFGIRYIGDLLDVCIDFNWKPYSEGANKFVRIRLQGNLFDMQPSVTGEHYRISGTLPTRLWEAPELGTIMNSLITVQDAVRNTAHSELPDYPAIISSLEQVLLVVG